MFLRSSRRIIYSVMILFYFIGSNHSIAAEPVKHPKLSFTTAGTLRFPYSLQPNDDSNVYLESFFKAALPVWKTDKAKVSLFLRGFYSGDSQEFSFNNRSKISVGVSYNRKISRTLNISLDLQYYIDNRYTTHQTQTGWRGRVSYFYYDNIWRNRPNGHKGWFRQNSWAKVWGVLTFPESLADGNRNLAFITGGELATAFVRPNSKLQYVPFVDLILAKDSYKLAANSKAIFGVGFKLRKSIKGGEISLGVKYAFDRRWTRGTTQSGVVVTGGWYKSF